MALRRAKKPYKIVAFQGSVSDPDPHGPKYGIGTTCYGYKREKKQKYNPVPEAKIKLKEHK